MASHSSVHNESVETEEQPQGCIGNQDKMLHCVLCPSESVHFLCCHSSFMIGFCVSCCPFMVGTESLPPSLATSRCFFLSVTSKSFSLDPAGVTHLKKKKKRITISRKMAKYGHPGLSYTFNGWGLTIINNSSRNTERRDVLQLEGSKDPKKQMPPHERCLVWPWWAVRGSSQRPQCPENPGGRGVKMLMASHSSVHNKSVESEEQPQGPLFHLPSSLVLLLYPSLGYNYLSIPG